jgi:hypothetical protein
MPDNDEAIRSEFLHQIEIAQQDLTAQLDALRRADTSHLHQDILAQGASKFRALSALQDQLVSGAKDVAALRASVASAVADIRAYTSDARSAASSAQGTPAQVAAVALQQASEAAHGTTVSFMHDYYDRRIFDPYLKFASPDDEEEYRRREDERKRAMDKSLAERTPEGNLRASQLALDQLKDAGAHGADRDPVFKEHLDRLEAATDGLAAKLDKTPSRSGQAEIDPLDAAKPSASVSPELLASLRASGVVIAAQDASGHGVTAPQSPVRAQPHLATSGPKPCRSRPCPASNADHE